MSIRMRAMTCGHLSCNAAPFMEGASGRITLPVPSYLIEHPRGKLLFDTGLHPTLKRDPRERLGGMSKIFEIDYGHGEDIGSRLQAIDVDPDAIDIVVNSHLHFDHAGGNELVPNARLIVQRPEWEAGGEPDAQQKNGFNPADYDLGHEVEIAEGEHDVFGDGSVVCVPTYGHTPGHQSLRVRLDAGEVVLTGDACYFRETLESMRLPSFAHDFDQMRASLETLRRLRDGGARIFYGHDPDFWKDVPQAPLEVA